MKRIDFHRVFVIAGLTALIIIYAVLWARMITNPAERTGADFIAFYAAGRIFLTGQISAVYTPWEQQMIEESVLGFAFPPDDLMPFLHPPFVLPVLALIAPLPYVWAFSAWAFLLLFLYFICAWLLFRIIPEAKDQVVLFAGLVLFYPAFFSILNGQDTALLLFGAAIWFYGLSKGDDRLAGIGLALMTIRPHVALLLAVPFLFRRQKVWWWFMGASAVLVVFSVMLIGVKGTENFFNLLIISGSGEGYKTNEVAMVNFIGLLRRLTPDFQSEYTRLAGWFAYAGAIIVLSIVWARSRVLAERHFGLAVILSVFFAPHLHYHDLTLLLVPLLALMLVAVRGNFLRQQEASLAPLVVSLILLFGYLIPALKYNIPYLVMGLMILATWFPAKIIPWRSKKDEIFP